MPPRKRLKCLIAPKHWNTLRQACAELAKGLRDALVSAFLPPLVLFLGWFGLLLASPLCIKDLDCWGWSGHPHRGKASLLQGGLT